MNKKSRITLIVLIAFVLVILNFGLVSASAPLPVNASVCSLSWMVLDKDGVELTWGVIGRASWIVEDSILTRTCTGHIPLGEKSYGKYHYDLEEMREYLAREFGADVGDPFVIGPAETGDSQIYHSYKGVDIESYNWTLYVNTNGDFEYEAYFNLE